MKIKITILLILFVTLKVTSLYSQNSSSLIPEFVLNAGQWDGPFQYKCSTTRGDFFVRKDGFTVLLSDSKNHEIAESVHHGRVKGPQTLNYFSYKINFVNSNKNPDLIGEKPLSHYYNYFIGNDNKKWKSGIHPCSAVEYKNIYNNVDIRVYSENSNIKYDIIVHPEGNIKNIQFGYEGVEHVEIVNKNLVVKTSLGEVTELAPYAYQFINGEKVEVPCEYRLKNGILAFEVNKKYDTQYDLIIDPTLIFCTFTGSTADNWGYTATNDTLGSLYAGGIVGYSTGSTFTGAYPVTAGAFQTTFGGGGPSGMGNVFQYDAAISKFDPTGANLLFATYLGGTDNDQPQSMIVDHNDNLVIAGRTYSTNFPTTPGAYDVTHNGGGDIFVVKFNPTGTTMLGGTFVGGSGDDAVNVSADETTITPNDLKHNYSDDARSEVIIDANNNVYVAAATKSTDFPVSANAIQTTNGGLQDGVVIELNASLSTLLWSTYIGGTNNDAAYVLSINKINPLEIFVAGGTISNNFPTTSGSLHTTYQGGIADGFVLKFNTTTKNLLAGTYIGTNAYDQVYGIQTDDSNHVYIVGQTQGAYPVTTGVYSNPNSSQFLTKLSNNLSTILASTVFGTGTLATTDIAPNAFLVDKCDNIYVSGWGGPIIGTNPGSTTGLITTPGAIKTTTDGSDFYFFVLSKDFVNLVYASFFGQNGGLAGEHVDGGTSRFDENGVIYQAICANCGGPNNPPGIFPTSAGAYSTTNPSPNCNLAALKIKFDFQNPNAVAIANGDTLGCAPMTVNFLNNSTSAVNYVWNFGDGSPTTTQVNPTHVYTQAGSYTATLIANNPDGCTTSSDTTSLTIVVKNDSINANFTAIKVDSCGPYTANFINTSTYNNGAPPASTQFFWDFGDATTFNGANPNPSPHVYPGIGNYTVTLVMTDTNACKSPDTMQVVLNFSSSNVASEFSMPDSVCVPAVVSFIDQSTNATTWNWTFGDGNFSSQSNPTNTFTSVGTYTVVLLSGNPNTCNKLDSSQHILHVLPSPIADFTWSPNPPEPNTPNTFTNMSTGATKYFWDFGDGTTSNLKDEVHVFQKDGDYTVCLTAYNEYGCPDTVCKQVRGLVIPLVDVPTGFSPNGDGVNDIVYVKGYGIEKMTFRIFNRWGEKLFESTDKSIGWDGRYKGVIQEMEVYGYTLSVDFFDGTKTFKKGNITLLK